MDPICQPNTRRPFCETPNPQLSTNPGLWCNSSITPRAGATAIREANVIFGQLICRTWEVNPVGHPNFTALWRKDGNASQGASSRNRVSHVKGSDRLGMTEPKINRSPATP